MRRASVVGVCNNMHVPFFRPPITEEDIAAVEACLRSGWLTTGPRVKEFEHSFAAYMGVEHAIALSSCTAALHLALEAIGVQRGDLVIAPTLTFAATAEVIHYFGATPVLVDVEPTTLCCDPALVEETLVRLSQGRAVAGVRASEGKRAKGKVRALIAVHYGGQMADMLALRRIANAYNIALVEDAAHCVPAALRDPASIWHPVGSLGDVACFSFYANKCITTGEGGMAVTSSSRWAERIRTMSLHGISQDAWNRYSEKGSWYYEIIAPGYKYNLTDMAAALGLSQIKRADQLLEQRRAIARRYTEAFTNVPGLILPTALDDRRHAWHLYPIRLKLEQWTLDRRRFIEELKGKGVVASVHWMPLHMHPYYRETYGFESGVLPVAEAAYDRLVSLPLFPGMRDEEVDWVVKSVVTLARDFVR